MQLKVTAQNEESLKRSHSIEEAKEMSELKKDIEENIRTELNK